MPRVTQQVRGRAQTRAWLSNSMLRAFGPAPFSLQVCVDLYTEQTVGTTTPGVPARGHCGAEVHWPLPR